MTNVRAVFIGEVTQIAGVASMVGGVVLSLRHWRARVALVGDWRPYFVGKKLRGSKRASVCRGLRRSAKEGSIWKLQRR